MERPGRLAVVGDVMLSSRRAEHYGEISPGFADAIARLGRSDLVVANLEVPLSQRGYQVRKTSNLRSHPDVVAGLPAMGIHAVSLANNHMMDYGPEALADTLAAVDAAGIARAGAGADLDEALLPIALDAGTASVGVVSVSCLVPVESDAGPGKPGIAPIRVGWALEIDANLMTEQPGSMPVVQSWTDPDDRAAVCEVIASLRDRFDVIVVMVHWGVPSFWLSPYQGVLAQYQRVLGHALIDAGADAVCGHHAHALHPVEMYRERPIFYGLGNFLFENPKGFMEPESVIAELDIGTGEWRLVPLMLDDAGFPALVRGDRALAVLHKLQALSQPFGDHVRLNDGFASLGREPAIYLA